MTPTWGRERAWLRGELVCLGCCVSTKERDLNCRNSFINLEARNSDQSAGGLLSPDASSQSFLSLCLGALISCSQRDTRHTGLGSSH